MLSGELYGSSSRQFPIQTGAGGLGASRILQGKEAGGTYEPVSMINVRLLASKVRSGLN